MIKEDDVIESQKRNYCCSLRGREFFLEWLKFTVIEPLGGVMDGLTELVCIKKIDLFVSFHSDIDSTHISILQLNTTPINKTLKVTLKYLY